LERYKCFGQSGEVSSRQPWAKVNASVEAHDWHRSIDHDGKMRRVRARKLCAGDQTWCCIAKAVKEGVLLYRESTITGRRVGREVEAMYTRWNTIGHASGC